MECEPGYTGPLCALCSDGYFRAVRDCNLCESMKIGNLIGVVLVLLVLIATVMYFSRKYRRYLDTASAFSRKCLGKNPSEQCLIFSCVLQT
jgi:hypothetical protein